MLPSREGKHCTWMNRPAKTLLGHGAEVRELACPEGHVRLTAAAMVTPVQAVQQRESSILGW